MLILLLLLARILSQGSRTFQPSDVLCVHFPALTPSLLLRYSSKLRRKDPQQALCSIHFRPPQFRSPHSRSCRMLNFPSSFSSSLQTPSQRSHTLYPRRWVPCALPLSSCLSKLGAKDPSLTPPLLLPLHLAALSLSLSSLVVTVLL
jgi:hypothetical protein